MTLGVPIRFGEHALAIGATGSGKTYFLQQYAQAFPRRIVYTVDRADGWQNLPDNQATLDGDKFEDDDAIIEAFCESWDRGARRITLLSSTSTLAGMRISWGRLCAMAYALGNVALVHDEIADVCGPTMKDIEEAHYIVMRMGRHRNVSHLAATQRHQFVNKAIQTQSRNKFVFRTDPYDLMAAKAWLSCAVEGSQRLRKNQWPEYAYYFERDARYSFCAPIKRLGK